MNPIHLKCWLSTAGLLLGLSGWAHNAWAESYDVIRYDVYKGAQFVQQSNTVTPLAGQPFLFTAVLTPNVAGGINSVSLTQTNGTVANLIEDAGGQWRLVAAASSADALFALYGGEASFHYQGQIDGDTTYALTLGPDNYPDAPRVLNLNQAASLDPDDLLILELAPFVGGTVKDTIHLEIATADGTVLYSTPAPGDPAALDGTATSVEVPPFSLFESETYTAKLTFYRMLPQDNMETPFVYAGFFAQTSFPIQTVATGTNSVPELLSSSPTNQANGVSTSPTVPVVFQFGDQMASGHSIQWSTNLDTNGFVYQWSPEETKLFCYYTNGWPANATITWILNPAASNLNNFVDSFGDELPINIYQGQFTTGLAIPKIKSVKAISAVELQLEVSCMTGRAVAIVSSADLKQWTPAWSTNNVATNSVTLKLPRDAGPHRFFQARQD